VPSYIQGAKIDIFNLGMYRICEIQEVNYVFLEQNEEVLVREPFVNLFWASALYLIGLLALLEFKH